MAKKFVSDDKDRERLKAQRETILKQDREIKLLKQQIKTLEKALNRPPKEEAPEKAPPPKKLTPEEEREAVRKKWADWRAKNLSTSEE